MATTKRDGRKATAGEARGGAHLLDEVAANVLAAHATVKALHWASPTYGAHVALDGLAASVSANGDRLVEALSGAVGARVSPPRALGSIASVIICGDDHDKAVDALVAYFGTRLPEALRSLLGPAAATQSLLSIRDEIVNDLFKAKYLLNFFSDGGKPPPEKK